MKNSLSDEKGQAKLRESAKLLYANAARYDPHWHSMPHTHSCSELFSSPAEEALFISKTWYIPCSEGILSL